MLTPRRPTARPGLRDERGQALPIVAIVLVALLLVLGVVVDGSNGFQNKQDVQNAADAIALAMAGSIAQDACTPVSGTDDCGGGKYAGLNHVNYSSPIGPSDQTTQIEACPSSNPCFVYPYVDSQGTSHPDEVEVDLTRTTSNFFGGLFGLATFTETAKAVGAVSSGPPPPYSFVALTGNCERHTMLIKSSGHLTVNNQIYVNSDAPPCPIPTDAFDVFGTGGTITAPDIFVAGGWEDHTGCSYPNCDTIFLHGQTPPGGAACPGKDNSDPGVATDPRCPHIHQQVIADPFAAVRPPPLGPPAWGGGSEAPVGITKVNRLANIATIVTASPHGLAAGDSVTIGGVGFGFDGTYTVKTVPSSTTFTYDNTLGSDGCGASPCPDLPVVTQKQMTSGVATLTTSAPHTLSTGDTVTVANLDNVFNVTNASVTGTTANTFSYRPSYAINVTKKQLQQGTATLTVNTTNGLAAGDTVSVSGLGSPFDGSWTVASVPSPTTFTYADPATTTLTISKKQITNTTKATLTTATNHVFPGDQITVATGDARFDGTYAATAGGQGGGGTTLSYTIPAVTASATGTAAAAGEVTMTTSAAPPFEQNDTVSVATGLLAYDGSVGVDTVSQATKSFTYTAPTFTNTGTWTKTGNAITVSFASAHGVHAGDSVTVSGAPGKAACSGTFPVSAATATGFTYTVPGTCNPGSSGNQHYSFQIASAGSASASGTVTLTSLPATSASGTVTAPAYVGSTNVTCTGCVRVTDVPPTTDSGTFSPAWTAVAGAMTKNDPGSPADPVQDQVPAGSSATLQPGTYYGGICIGLAAGTTCNDKNCAAALVTASYGNPQPTLAAAIDASQTQFNVTGQKISAGDVINVGSEDMLVTSVSPNGGGQTLTVSRGYLASTNVASAGGASTHSAGATILKVVSSVPSATATLAAGTYVMAGGGLYVCGSANLVAPNVLVYNTDDTVGGKELAPIGQIELFTLGNVTLGPQTSGPYSGLTIFQDHSHEVDTTSPDCNHKSNQSSSWDIALVAMGSSGANGPLGSISGTIYASQSQSGTPEDDFGDAVSGTANLAVLTDCIYIDGATSTFNFQSSGLFGIGATLSG